IVHGLGSGHAFIRVDTLRDIVRAHTDQIRDYATLVRLFRARGFVVKRIAYFHVAEMRSVRKQHIGTNTLRGFRGCLAGMAIAIVAMVVAAVMSPAFRETVGPKTALLFASHSFGWPAPVLMVLIAFGIPSLAAGSVVTRLAHSRFSMWTGLFGIAVGCW